MARDGADFGAIEVSGKPRARSRAADELALEDLARIASLAIENARLEERERHIARTLQASLLPRTLPEIEGLRRPRATSPGGEGTVVGGDLYDLFAVEDEWALVVGDVCGKGAEAAALTAMVRYTVRAEAVHHSARARCSGCSTTAILRQFDDGRFCTVAARALRGRGRRALGSGRLRRPPAAARAARGRRGGDGRRASGPLLGVVPGGRATPT